MYVHWKRICGCDQWCGFCTRLISHNQVLKVRLDFNNDDDDNNNNYYYKIIIVIIIIKQPQLQILQRLPENTQKFY